MIKAGLTKVIFKERLEGEVGVSYSSSVQSLSCVFETPRTAACQASLSITNSQSLLKLMSTELVMPSNHIILYHPPSPPALNLSQHQSLFK